MAQVTFTEEEQEAAINSDSHLFRSHGNASMHLLNLDEATFDHQYVRSGGFWIIAIRSTNEETLKQAAVYKYFIVN